MPPLDRDDRLMRYGGQANQVQGGLAQQALALGWAEGPPGTPRRPPGARIARSRGIARRV